MAEVPSGPLSEAMDDVRVALTRCATFQAWCGDPGSAETAWDHVFIAGTAEGYPAGEVTPLALVRLYPPSYWARKEAEGYAPTYSYGGRLLLTLRNESATEYVDGYEDRFLEHANLAAEIIGKELPLQMSVLGRPLTQFTEERPAQAEDSRETLHYFESAWLLYWGVAPIVRAD